MYGTPKYGRATVELSRPVIRAVEPAGHPRSAAAAPPHRRARPKTWQDRRLGKTELKTQPEAKGG